MREGTYFHGTDAVLAVGDVLVPGAHVGRDNWDNPVGTDVVWLHDNVEWASKYGPHVYEVEPLEWVENYSEEAGHTDEMASPAEWEYVTPKARIVRLVS